MIESIKIASCATYGNEPEEFENLKKLNFVFGSNGTGKTTISRIIADEDSFQTCKVVWKDGMKLNTIVYNRDFVEKAFSQSKELKGVFTLGENNVETLSRIAEAKTEIEKINSKITNRTQALKKQQEDLDSLETRFREKCWSKKQKYDKRFKIAFEGYRGDSEKFKQKILDERSRNTTALLSLADLEKSAETIFGSKPSDEQPVPTVEAKSLITYESATILEKRIIGKNDVDIAAMINRLEISDWIKQGLIFYKRNEGVCPFCQQNTTQKFAQSLEEYFDETFQKDSRYIEEILSSYIELSKKLQQQITLIITIPSKFLDVEKLKQEKELLDSKLIVNIQRLENKKREPSHIIQLEPIKEIIVEIDKIINLANINISKHNKMVANFRQEKADLTAKVWRYVLEEINPDYEAYINDRDRLTKTITSLEGATKEAKREKSEKELEIQELEKKIKSTKYAMNEINCLLSSFGFQGFSLAEAGGGVSYKLIRPDGSDAKTTLSEGEKTFIMFLYFYHLLKGSDLEAGITDDRVVVFDDPVSSLDSDVLFIVGSLLKRLFDDIRDSKNNHIKQIFILTHNVYFYKEITFNSSRSKDTAMNDETFWVAKKTGLFSKLENFTTVPVKTSYELLWSEVRNPNRSNLTIQNTLRRILETYFRFFGNIDIRKVCENFSGKDQIVCNALLSWINDGSHFPPDDIHTSIYGAEPDNYLNVFREIFNKLGHSTHYKMMMGDAYTEENSMLITSK